MKVRRLIPLIPHSHDSITICVTTGGLSSSCEMIILGNKSHGEIIRVCMEILTTALRNINSIKFSIKIPHLTSTVRRLLSDRLLFWKEPILVSYPFLGLLRTKENPFVCSQDDHLTVGPLVVLLDMLDTYSKIICRLYDGALQYLASRNRKSHNFDEFFVETSLLFVSNVSTARHTMFCFGRMAVLPSKFRCFPVNDKFNSFETERGCERCW